MAKSAITMQIKGCDSLIKQLEGIGTAGRKAISSTVKDLTRAALKLVADEVGQTYTIDKKEIKPGSTRKDKNGNKQAVKQAGSIRISGETIESFTMTYTGHLLTPTHFKMSPKAPPAGKSYKLTMEVVKGKKKLIGRYESKRTPGGPYSERSHNILMGTGNTKEAGVNWIPFQRMSRTRTDLRKFTTVSVPQMVDNEQVNERIHEALNSRAEARLNHYMERYLGK